MYCKMLTLWVIKKYTIAARRAPFPTAARNAHQRHRQAPAFRWPSALTANAAAGAAPGVIACRALTAAAPSATKRARAGDSQVIPRYAVFRPRADLRVGDRVRRQRNR